MESQILAKPLSTDTQDTEAPARHSKIAIVAPPNAFSGDLARSLKALGYDIEFVTDDASGISRIASRRHALEAVVMDRRGADKSNLETYEHWAATPNLNEVPVLLVLGSQDEDQVKAALQAGLLYYLRAPFRTPVLQAHLQALAQTRESHIKPLSSAFDTSLVDSCKFRIRTPSEARQVQDVVANFFPDRRRALLGFEELVSNSIEHGNLEMGRVLRSNLARSGALQQEIYVRLAKPEFKDRSVEVLVARREDGVLLTVTDQGPGFEWKEHLDIDPSFANLEHGRGIARARHLAFDSLTYNARGNQAVALMTRTRHLQW